MQQLRGVSLRVARPSWVSDHRIRLVVQFIMFGLVGAVGFLIDTATIYALRHSVGLYVSGIGAYFTAATGTWFCNRVWTFRHSRAEKWHVQWRRFLVANLSGFVINRGVYALLVTFWAAATNEPVIAVLGGALAGMTLNFNLSRKMVFR